MKKNFIAFILISFFITSVFLLFVIKQTSEPVQKLKQEFGEKISSVEDVMQNYTTEKEFRNGVAYEVISPKVSYLDLIPKEQFLQRAEYTEKAAYEFMDEFQQQQNDFRIDYMFNLYSPYALIRTHRYTPFFVRDITMVHKDLLEMTRIGLGLDGNIEDFKRALESITREKGDYATYSELEYSVSSDGIRVEGKRYSHSKNHKSPFDILLKYNSEGDLVIVEQFFETIP